jgi:hypothetical protein
MTKIPHAKLLFVIVSKVFVSNYWPAICKLDNFTSAIYARKPSKWRNRLHKNNGTPESKYLWPCANHRHNQHHARYQNNKQTNTVNQCYDTLYRSSISNYLDAQSECHNDNTKFKVVLDVLHLTYGKNHIKSKYPYFVMHIVLLHCLNIRATFF